jgi:predicted lipoprotein
MRKAVILAAVPGLALLAFAILAFGFRAGGRADPLTKKVLEEIGSSVILPDYRRFAAEAERMRGAALAFEREPTEGNQASLRSAWRGARRAWKLCEPHFVGPEAKRILQAKIDTSSINTEKIEEIVAGPDPLDPAYVERLGANRKGFAAIEYLLFDGKEPPGSTGSPLAADSGSARRRKFIAALAGNLAGTAAEIRDIWEPDRGNYLAEFLRGRAELDAPFPEKVSIDDLINHLIGYTEDIADIRLGRPLGIRASPLKKPDPSLLESRWSGNSVEDLLASLDGVRVIYEGAPDRGLGLAARVKAVSPEIHRAILEALEKAAAGLKAIPVPLSKAVGEQNKVAIKAVERLIELRSRFKVDLASIYQTRITVIRFDGD